MDDALQNRVESRYGTIAAPTTSSANPHLRSDSSISVMPRVPTCFPPLENRSDTITAA